MAAGEISIQVKTQINLSSAWNWAWTTMDPNPATNLSCGFAIGTFQAFADLTACAERTEAVLKPAMAHLKSR